MISALAEGTSINATWRITGVAKHTVLKLLKDLGCACAEYDNRIVRNLNARRVQCDEIWAVCYAKDRNVPAEKQGKFGYGSVWTWTALDADSKLILSYAIGTRGMETTRIFMDDLSRRVASRIQLPTNGHRVYADAVEGAFGCNIGYAVSVKLFGNDPTAEATRYSPATCIGCRTAVMSGRPDPAHASTSFVERQNLSMRMGMRRFTRLPNGFSKKLEKHGHAVALYFMHYNFCRIHKTLRVTPAMEPEIADRVWTMEELMGLLSSTSSAVAA
jgi:IS1 family transposase